MAIEATRIYARYPDAHGVSLNGIGGRSILLQQVGDARPLARRSRRR